MIGVHGGLYWTRTSDPIDVNDVLYQLSQQTIRRNDVSNNTMAFLICQEGILKNMKFDSFLQTPAGLGTGGGGIHKVYPAYPHA
jgi:hypothetical protein